VKFPMFSKIDVNGSDAAPLYNFLKENSELNKEGKVENIPWNFAKFIVNGKGEVLHYFHPKVHPDELVGIIEKIIHE
jgi:glutathione peroxidase